MRTRPDAQQEALTRRLALLHADDPASDEEGWWAGPSVVPEWTAEEVAPVAGGAPPIVVPEPGRHAARRSLAIVPRLPEALQGRVRLGAAQLAVVALAVAAALALTCWWLARGRATALSPVVAPSVAASPLVALTASAAPQGATASRVAATGVPGAATSAATMVTVDVEGKVRHPGIAILPAGSRVTDALKAAGGTPHRSALHGLNLAAVLTDGQQIVVGAPQSPAGATLGGVGAGTSAGDGALVNLNTATAEQLDTLPDVGPVTAQSILEWREQNGRFTSVQELLEVDGIGPATLAKLAPHVTV